MRGDDVTHNTVLELIRQPLRQIWIGNSPPFDMPTIDIENATAFRTSPALHQAWDVVWVYERFISDYDSWRLALDEVLRLLPEHGLLVLRYKTRRVHFSNFGLKHFLFRRPYHRLSLAFEDGVQTDSGFVATSIFRVERPQIERYRDRSWTFAVVTQGTKVDNVVRFCQSIRSQDPGRAHEIVVHGPADDRYAPFDVRYVETTTTDAFGVTLGMKKNTIAAAAQRPNLLIAHDRYILDPGFFEGFERFGYDFDLCTVRQTFEDGTPYPAYCALNGTGLVWAPTVHCENYNVLHANQYVNGGLMVFKTQALRDLRFNDLLPWNQAEDVEICRVFMDTGLPPRMNYFASATTIDTPKPPPHQWKVDRDLAPFD